MEIIKVIFALAVLTLVCIVAPQFVDAIFNGDINKPGMVDSKLVKGQQTVVALTPGEWRKALSPELYKVARSAGTEAPFSGKYNDFFEQGLYYCYVCGNELFSSADKFTSKTGWPSFKQPINDICTNRYEVDVSLIKRVGVQCSRCTSHIGYLYTDVVNETDILRYSINSISLRFISSKIPE